MSALGALSGLLGVLVGAVLTYWLGSRAEVAKAYQKQRTDAYVEFIDAVAAVAVSQRTLTDQSKLSDAITRLTRAKSKIAIYGSKPVASALAAFVRNTHGWLDTEKDFQSFVEVVALMRADTPGGGESLSLDDMKEILFGN